MKRSVFDLSCGLLILILTCSFIAIGRASVDTGAFYSGKNGCRHEEVGKEFRVSHLSTRHPRVPRVPGSRGEPRGRCRRMAKGGGVYQGAHEAIWVAGYFEL